MKAISPTFFVILFLAGCNPSNSSSANRDQPAGSRSTVKPGETTTVLTGVVLRKEWSKSYESFNAGGSEYYVLKIDNNAIPANKRTATEGVILRPSKDVPFERFANLVGQTVTCRGNFVDGKPYAPPTDGIEQVPSSHVNPITGETVRPIVGSGFQVRAIEPK